MFKQIYNYLKLFEELRHSIAPRIGGKRSKKKQFTSEWFEISLNFSKILKISFHSFAQETVVLR